MILKLKSIGLAGALAMVAGQATAAEWAAVTFTAQHVAFLDTKSVTTVGNVKRAWFWLIYENSTATQGRNTRQLEEFDCQQRTLKTLQLTDYNGRDVGRSFGPLSASFATPGSYGESLVEAACSTPPMLVPMATEGAAFQFTDSLMKVQRRFEAAPSMALVDELRALTGK